MSETWPFIKPFLPAGTALDGFDGWLLEGSVQASLYDLFFTQLRKDLFIGTTGNFVSDSNFNQVAQVSVMVQALRGKTKVNYLAGRSAADVVRGALAKVSGTVDLVKGYGAWSIPYAGQASVHYRNRGTYIQVIELGSTVRGRNVLPPGVSATGVHSQDQIPLSRAWVYKPMSILP